MLVCSACADEAREIGIPVEAAADKNDRLPRMIREKTFASWRERTAAKPE